MKKMILLPAALRPVSKRPRRKLALVVAAALVALVATQERSHAAYFLTLSQVGGNVMISGSGTLNLTGLSAVGPSNLSTLIYPSIGLINSGSAGAVDVYSGLSPQSGFGTGGGPSADSATGSTVGILGNNGQLEVPAGYISGTPLSGTETFNNATLSSLGFTPGTYTYSWGSDSFTVSSAAVPEPATWAGGALLLGGAALTLRRRARRA